MGQVKRRMLINAVFGCMSYAMAMLVGLVMTPFLLSRLGDEVYSVIPLVNSLIIFLSLVSMGIYSALGRYVTYLLAREEHVQANEYLNTGFGLLARKRIADEKVHELQRRLLVSHCSGVGAPLAPVDGKISMQLLVDRPMVEVCGNDGRVFITQPFNGAPVESVEAFCTGGGAKLESFEVYELKSIWK